MLDESIAFPCYFADEGFVFTR